MATGKSWSLLRRRARPSGCARAELISRVGKLLSVPGGIITYTELYHETSLSSSKAL